MCSRPEIALPALQVTFLGGSVNDLKTTFRDGIAVEGAIVGVEASIGRPLDAQTLHEIDGLNFTLRDLTRHAQCPHLGAS